MGQLIAARLLTYGALRKVRRAGMTLRDVVVVGCGAHCQRDVRKMEPSPASGFRASAMFDVFIS